MAKLTLNDVANGSTAGIAQINANFAAIEVAIENTVSRDGTLPNQMSGDLDLNHNNLLNIGDLEVDNIIIDGSDMGELVERAETAADEAEAASAAAIAAAEEVQGLTTFNRVVIRGTTAGTGPYDMGVGNVIGTANNLDVKLGGVLQDHNTYTVAGTTFTFLSDPGTKLYEAVLTAESRLINTPADASVGLDQLDSETLALVTGSAIAENFVFANKYGAVFDESPADIQLIKDAALYAIANDIPFVVPNIGLDRDTGLVLQVPEDIASVQEAHDAMLTWVFPGARPKTVADNVPITSNHIPQICVTISVAADEYIINATNITWNHPSGNVIRVTGRDRTSLTLASQQEITYSSGVHFLRLRFSNWPATDPEIGRTMRVILAPGSSSGSGAYQNFDGGWRITAVNSVNKDITFAVYAKTDTSLLTATVSSGTFLYIPTLFRATNVPHSGADVGLFDVHTTLRLGDVALSGDSSGTNASSTNGIIVREGAKLLLEQYVAVVEFQRSGLWLLNDAYAQIGYAAFCGNNSGINNLQSIVDGTNASVQGNTVYGYIGGIGSSASIVLSAFGGCGTAGILINGNASFIGSGHSRRSAYGVLIWPGGFANINDMNVRANTTKDVKRHGGGRCLLTDNDVGTFEPALGSGDSYGGFTALTSTLAAVV